MWGRAWKKAQFKYNIEQGWMVPEPIFYEKYLRRLKKHFDLKKKMWNSSFIIFNKFLFTKYEIRNNSTNSVTTKYSIKLL